MTAPTLPSRDEPLALPRAAAKASRPPIPILTAIVPVVGAVVLWAVTGSPFALWFALLGPLIALASVADAARGARRARRRHAAHARIALTGARSEVERRHGEERAERWTRHPDVARFVGRPETIWRTVAAREGMLVVGAGEGVSEIEVTGGDGHDDATELRRGAVRIADVPVLVPLHAGIAVIGPPMLAAAVARGLALQACLCLAPGRLRLDDDGPTWTAAVPHRTAAVGALLQLREVGGLVGADVDVPIVVVPEGAPPPPRCGAVLRLTGVTAARLDLDGRTQDVVVEPVSEQHAVAVAAMLADRAARALGTGVDQPLPFAALLAAAPAFRADAAVAAFATAGGEPLPVDLVGDGPHAIVTGVTGSGKSELLTSWVVGLCRAHTPAQLAFLLVDFKGGRTFDHLTPLPHVTGVLTDLDEATAVRAIVSLRAEVRHRERVLAESGARDVADAPGLGRLVIVVDEYAALVAAQPSLHDLFGDLAARGRALGIHLVLATQRATGVFRDAVLTNAPLRISLRVTDAADSRAVLGVDDAARLPGRADARGLALVRRAGDPAPVAARVARCDRDSLAAVVARTAGAQPARRPWLPSLPEVVPLEALRRDGTIVLGLADEPDRQRQEPLAWDEADVGLAVIGGPGSGRSGILHAIAAQAPIVVVDADSEAAWDILSALDDLTPGTVVAVDDLDALLARSTPEYAAAVVERLERALRGGRARGIRVVVTAQRLGGAVARLVELIPRRLVLALPTRADHVAAGGRIEDHRADLPPGRGRLDGRLVQVALAAAPRSAEPIETAALWHPGRRPAAVVVPAGARSRRLVAAWQRGGVEVHQVEQATELRRGAVVIGPPDAWLAQWRLLAEARAEADLVVDASCTAEYRALTGLRDLPPLAHAGRGRAWWHAPDRPVRRVRLGGD